MPTDPLLGRILLGRYRTVRVLGAGAHGRVFLAEDLVRGGERLALKLVEGLVGAGSDDPAQRQLRWFRHPNWAAILDAGRCGEYDWFQATRFIDGPSLATLEGPQPVEWIWRLLEDGARVLRALHRRGLIHYDVTPGNLLVEGAPDAPRFVLTDGGLANVGPVHGFARGTPLYMAPEVTEDRHHDHRADLYSLGLVAYRVATGVEPLSGGAGDVLGRRRREPAPHARDRRPDLPPALDALIAALLAPDPAQRVASGDDLLARIARERPGTPDVLPEEAIAAATSGALVGREDIQARFERMLASMVQHVPHDPPGGSPTTHPEQVLLLEGPPGSGATRLARELAAAARRAELPVLLLAGREGAPDRRSPLRRLVDGLVTLQRPAGAAVAQVVLSPRGSGAVDRDEVAHSDGRAIEKFLAVVEESARRTPYVLIVEDFSDLPPLAQEAIRVLSRHLLGRAERATGQAPLPMALVVDLGHEPVEAMASPDASDVRRAVAVLPRLTMDEVSALCRERFPGLDLPQASLAALARAADGQPANVTTLMAEAYRRGDLQREDGAWTWDTDRLAAYGAVRRLPPPQEEALRAAPPALRRFLDRMALAESEVPLGSARVLWSRLGPGDVPTSSLLSVREHGDAILLTLATAALQRVLLASLTPETRERCAADLYAALDVHPDPRTVVDRVALLLELRRPAAALSLAHGSRASLTADQRQALQPLIRRALELDPTLLDDPAPRHTVVELLTRGPDAVAIAQQVASRIPRTAADLPDILAIATVLEDAYQLDALADLLSSAVPITSAPAHLLADLHIRRARTAQARRMSEEATQPLRRARAFLRSLGSEMRTHRRLLVDYLKVLSHSRFGQDRLRSAAHALRHALRHAKLSGSPALHATALNNLGVTCRAQGNLREAEAHLRRALRLRRPLGDISGAIGTQYNLARVYLSQGLPAKAAARLQEAAGLAARHNLGSLLATCLRELAGALDQLDSPGPALECLRRGVRVSVRHGLLTAGARMAHEQAPLAMLMGEPEACREALVLSAKAARARAFADARPLHYLSLALTATYAGVPETASWALRRAQRSSEHLAREDRFLTSLVPLAISPREVGSTTPRTFARRPAPRTAGRFQYRTGLAVARASRRSHHQALLLKLPKTWAGEAAALPKERRLAQAMILALLRESPQGVPGDLWRTLARTSTGPADALLLGRALALQAVADQTASPSGQADLFSRSLAPIAWERDALPRYLRQPPIEHRQAARTLRRERVPRLAGTGDITSLHATAHALLLRASRHGESDARRADALHQLLAAISQFEAHVELGTLLQRLTRIMLEITGAQRACIVLLEREPIPQMRVATSTSSGGTPVDDQDLSHTVIHRVLTTRSPLLLHDAFGDEELLGRPSIAALSLRSIICVPMQRNGTVLGVMYADSSAGAGSFDQVDLEVLALLAEQAAAAVEANQLVTSLQTAYAELRAMQDRLVKTERLRVLGEVTSGVAHEFNNLLTAILARVQLMGLACPDPEQRDHLSLIEKAALDAAGVVRRLQSFSKQQRTSTFVLVDVAEICSDAVEFLRPLWSTRRRHGRPPIAVRLACQPGLQVRGNPSELREILTNLLKNSLDAVSERGGQIYLQTHEDSGNVHIRVHDDGPGIPAELLGKVFLPFFTTKGDGGTGLGLCLSQRLAEQHGGELRLESAQGTGTTATLRLPRHEAALQIPGASAGTPPPAPRAHSRRVLVVDDDQDVLRPLCTYLEQAGYLVSSASSGQMALERLRASPPDLLLTDIGMPNMDGLELCAKAMALRPNLPVVLMSGWASDVDPARARAVGAQALLAKPFAMQQVCDILARIPDSTASAPGARPEARG